MKRHAPAAIMFSDLCDLEIYYKSLYCSVALLPIYNEYSIHLSFIEANYSECCAKGIFPFYYFCGCVNSTLDGWGM